MPFRLAVPALVVLMLALFPAAAQADPWAIRGYEPDDPVAGDLVTFHADREKGSGDPDSLVWDFDDGSAFGAGSDPTHVYAAADTYTVKLYLPGDGDTLEFQDSVDVTVEPAPPPNTPPSAAFTFSPPGPLVGEDVLFTGGSDPDGDPITREWDFGDGTPVSSEAAPAHAYAAAGPYTVALSVMDDRGGFDSTLRDLTVSPQPPPPGGGAAAPVDPVVGGGNSDPARAPVRMKPFPVVRMAGLVLPSGALVKILSVRAPVGATARVRCRGKACPAPTLAHTVATRLRTLRFRAFERRLAAGTVLELFIRKPGRIGKYTRFLIRAGKAPTRVDRCLMPGRRRPGRCA